MKMICFCLSFICLLCVSCEKDPIATLPGEWEVVDHPGGLGRGSIIFNADGTGKVIEVGVFLTIVGLVRGEANFTWEVLPGASNKTDILRVVVEGNNRTNQHDYTMKVKSKNRIILSDIGLFVLDIDKALIR